MVSGKPAACWLQFQVVEGVNMLVAFFNNDDDRPTVLPIVSEAHEMRQ
jgi:hypothetical protein